MPNDEASAPVVTDEAATKSEPAEPAPPAADGSAGRKEAPFEPEQGDLKTEAPAAPDGYALKFAEGTQVDEKLLGDFKTAAHGLGLTGVQAQKLADLYAGHMKGLPERMEKAQIAAHNDYVNKMNAELAKRPAFKEDLGYAQRTLREFGSEDLAKVLQGTAIGSHPAMFDFVVKVGRALGEPAFRGQPGSEGKETPLYERLWPDRPSAG